MLSPDLPALTERDRSTRRRRVLCSEISNETNRNDNNTTDQNGTQVSNEDHRTPGCSAGQYTLRVQLLNLRCGGDIAAELEDSKTEAEKENDNHVAKTPIENLQHSFEAIKPVNRWLHLDALSSMFENIFICPTIGCDLKRVVNQSI